MGKLNFHEKKQNRIDKYRELADKADQKSTQAYNESKRMTSVIPPGQPILVGHHSEKGHRRLLQRSWDKMGKSVELSDKADYYRQKAEAAESNNAISSDDPDAIEKITKKIESLEKYHESMKGINKICRSKKLSDVEKFERLESEYNLKQETVNELLYPRHSYMGVGFQGFALSNNKAEINRLKKRLKTLKTLDEMESYTIEFDYAKVYVNTEDNRVEIHFDSKPDFTFRKKIKSYGFRWSREKCAWQMKISRWNIGKAKELAEEYKG